MGCRARAVAGLIAARLFLSGAVAAAAPACGEGIEWLRARIAEGGGEVLVFTPADRLFDVFLPIRRDKGLERLTVVVPGERPFAEENLSAWKEYLFRMAAGRGDAFSLDGGALAGTIEGLAVRIVPVGQWRRPPRGGTVILDLSFLPALYQDEVRTPFVELVRKFLATLDDRKMDVSRVRPWVAAREEIPLAYGYLGKLMTEVIRAPAAFRKGLPPKWEELRLGEYFAFFSAFEDAAAHFENYLREEPEDPAVLFRMAMMRFVDREIEQGLRYLHRAFRSDPFYARGYHEAAMHYAERGDLAKAERILRAGLLGDTANAELKGALARVLLEEAKRMLSRDSGEAESRFAEVAALGLPAEAVERLRAEWEKAKAAGGDGDGRSRVPKGHPRF